LALSKEHEKCVERVTQTPKYLIFLPIAAQTRLTAMSNFYSPQAVENNTMANN